uniref:Uncharacterized protein n=1 Tax=Chromera velia CCMP2878 TaxID=1169474 RepID=A0A0G4F9V2_9ALVE|eukprot:Cvel_15953.t1-p1 / transcript=Cvel_15953.t1 / gene=Cvel_15953 / organism=Chromera_velia_CCMP2878 / gene_product=hypothetical protein / transcript_product=hypothetical protein / location=Cvel_scaffold1207:6258-7436(+) / protein_length=393 / sequence_SO=supercontig / SO=protein_coding / is_pseudo=false
MSTCPTAYSDSARSPAFPFQPLTGVADAPMPYFPGGTEQSTIPMKDRKVVTKNTFITIEFHPQEQRRQTGIQRLQSEPAMPVSFGVGEDGKKELIDASSTTNNQQQGSEETSDPVGSAYLADLRSIGSLRHKQGCCPEKRCYWHFSKQGCSRGWFCDHCHYCKPVSKTAHDKGFKKAKEAVKEKRRREQLPAPARPPYHFNNSRYPPFPAANRWGETAPHFNRGGNTAYGHLPFAMALNDVHRQNGLYPQQQQLRQAPANFSGVRVLPRPGKLSGEIESATPTPSHETTPSPAGMKKTLVTPRKLSSSMQRGALPVCVESAAASTHAESDGEGEHEMERSCRSGGATFRSPALSAAPGGVSASPSPSLLPVPVPAPQMTAFDRLVKGLQMGGF